jgi:membrane-bound ClpP family serine protease
MILSVPQELPMEFFISNPNVAYLIIVLTSLLIFCAVVTPGTGVLEILAFGAILASVVLLFSLQFNTWALALIALSIIPFVLALYRQRGRSWLLPLSIGMVTVGSIFLFVTPQGKPAVNPLIAIVTSVLADGFLWFAVHKGLQAQFQKADNTLEDIVGHVGEAKTDIHTEGSAFVDGQLWSARSEQKIPPGSKVKVTGRSGFILIVEQQVESQS